MDTEDILFAFTLGVCVALLVLAMVVFGKPENARQVGTFQSTVKITP